MTSSWSGRHFADGTFYTSRPQCVIGIENYSESPKSCKRRFLVPGWDRKRFQPMRADIDYYQPKRENVDFVLDMHWRRKLIYILTTDSLLGECGIRTQDHMLIKLSPAAGSLAAARTMPFVVMWHCTFGTIGLTSGHIMLNSAPALAFKFFVADMHWRRETHIYSHNWQSLCLTDVGFEPRITCWHAKATIARTWLTLFLGFSGIVLTWSGGSSSKGTPPQKKKKIKNKK